MNVQKAVAEAVEKVRRIERQLPPPKTPTEKIAHATTFREEVRRYVVGNYPGLMEEIRRQCPLEGERG
jgi:hypothetical protein